MSTVKRCPFCGVGTRSPGETTLTLTRGDRTVVIRRVPAQVCPACGEALIAGAVLDEVQALAELAFAGAGRCEVRDYAAKVA